MLRGVADTTAVPSGEASGNPAAEASERLRARIAWYYFVGGLTQQDISQRVGLTRARVNRILASCRADGMVRVDIRSPHARCVELEQALVARRGLTDRHRTRETS